MEEKVCSVVDYFTDLSDCVSHHISKSPSPEIAQILADAVFDVAKTLIK